MEPIKVRRSEVKDIVDASFPDYRGRKISVVFADTITFWDTNWHGGTRNVYKAVASDGRVAKLDVPAPWVNVIEGQSSWVPRDAVVVEHSIFCGKDLGLTIHAHTSHAPAWLPEGPSV